MDATRKIPAKKRGNRLGFWFFKSLLRSFGLRGAYGLLYGVCLHYLIFDRAAVRGAMAYVVRRFPGSGPVRRLGHVYRLFLSQGRQLIDRYAVLSGAAPFEFDVQGADAVREALTRDGRGLVLLTAHVGNWQIASSTLRNMNRAVHLVMRPEDNEAVSRALRLGGQTDHLKVISPEGELGGVIEIMNALRAGDLVSFMGDRPYDFEAMEVQFLGGACRFPCGAFQIAASARCPMLILLCARTGSRRYRVDFTRILHPVYEKGISKRDQVQRWMQQFADILEAFVTEFPYQCFLFMDVWAEAEKTGSG